MDFRTPDTIIAELVDIRRQAGKGADAQFEAEEDMVRLVLAAERIEALAFMEATGTVEHCKAVAKVKSEEARLAADIAKAKLNRIKTKLRQLSEAQMNVQSQARMVELMYKTAGTGER